ncbi:MAG: hypothetical protein EOP83_13420 [Verrucomicrobiaceae bacterium]|nr:MAG: hypothetical protein EOP83_13420 [Verrucomicrobiaceae bacterium]
MNGVGNRRKRPFRMETMGWAYKRRDKVSPLALDGFAYEVRLRHVERWPFHGTEDPCPYAELLDTLRRTTDARICGDGPYTGKGVGRKVWSIRIYLRTEADLFHLRMLTTDDVFRVYALHAPEPA